MIDWDINDVKDIEKSFLRLDDVYLPSDRECNIQIDIMDAGSWILKFRKFGMIFNNKELIIGSTVDVDATIIFDSIKHYNELLRNHSVASIPEAVSRGHIRTNGLDTAIEIFQRKISHYQSNLNPAASSSSASAHANDTASPSSSSLSVTKFYRMNYNGDLIQPLKHGWLHKKRDIFTGWRPRYIVVYYGRVEYYENEHDRYPRDVISLLGAEVSIPKKCAVNGEPDHYYIVVEPRGLGGSKILKLASEYVGINAHAEAWSWVKVFQVASKSSDSSSIHYTNINSGSRSSMHGSGSASNIPALDLSAAASSSSHHHVASSSLSSSLARPLSSARNLFSRISYTDHSHEDDHDMFVDGIGYESWLVMGVGSVMSSVMIGGGWYMYGWNGMMVGVGIIGMIMMIMALYMMQKLHITQTRATAISDIDIMTSSSSSSTHHTHNDDHHIASSTSSSSNDASSKRPSKTSSSSSSSSSMLGSTITAHNILLPLSQSSTSTAPSRTTSKNSTSSYHHADDSSNGQSDFNGVYKDVSGDGMAPANIISTVPIEAMMMPSSSSSSGVNNSGIEVKQSTFTVRKFFAGMKDKEKDKDRSPTMNDNHTTASLSASSPPVSYMASLANPAINRSTSPDRRRRSSSSSSTTPPPSSISLSIAKDVA